VVDRAVMERRIRALHGLIEGLRRRFSGMTLEAFLRDEDARLIAERLLHLACEACIDMANHAIADRGAEQPESYREAFEQLGKLGLVPPELSASLRQMVSVIR
jgi:uncharacterized protein YutE (UPF0331/DUF86 family)